MSMFQELYELSRVATLTLVISADDKQPRMTINVIPKPKAGVTEPALSEPLTLTASPDEFDAEFVDVLRNFRSKRESLTAQAETTNELLEAAKEASAKKGATAVAKASAKQVKPSQAKTSARASQEDEDSGEGDDTDREGAVSGQSPSPAAGADASSAAPATPNLFG